MSLLQGFHLDNNNIENNNRNASCHALTSWEVEGSESRGYHYVFYVTRSTLFSEDQINTQIQLLRWVAELQKIHPFSAEVKCLGYTSESISSAGTAKAKMKELFKDMLAADSVEAMSTIWAERKDEINLFENEGSSKTMRQAIGEAIERAHALDDSTARGLIEPEVFAALARYDKGWELSKFLATHQKIFQEERSIQVKPISELRAQFSLIFRAAEASFSSETATPTIAISFLPPSVPKATFSSMKKGLFDSVKVLQRTARSVKDSERQDSYSAQMVSLCHGKGGEQWQQIDDLKSGNKDFMDHTPLDVEKFGKHGPGSAAPKKIMLGSVDADADRSKGQSKSILYGLDCPEPTKEQMEACTCRQSPQTQN